jgi:outer membrane putative beta-barrel porin/alpha-amylase
MRGRFYPGIVAIAALAVLLAAGTPAPACDSTSCALVTRGPGGTLPKGALRVDLSYRQADQTEPWAGGDPTDTVLRPKVDFEHGFILAGYHREVGGTDRYLQCDVAYGVSSRASVFLGVPLLIQRSYDIAHGGSFLQTSDTKGFGDILTGVQYAVLKGASHQLVARGGLKMPTGEFRLISGFDQTINDPTLQPGTGSWDFATGADFTRFNLLGLDWTASASYQANTTNDLQYRFGDDAIGSLTMSRSLVGKLGGSLQVKGWHKGRSTFLDRPVPSTGATIVYLTPGLRFAAPAAMSAYAFLQVPVYRYVNEAQLTPRLAFYVGWAKTF